MVELGQQQEKREGDGGIPREILLNINVKKEARHPDWRLLAEQTDKTVHSSMARVQVVIVDPLGINVVSGGGPGEV